MLACASLFYTCVNRIAVWTLSMSGIQYLKLLYQYQIILYGDFWSLYFVLHCEHGTYTVKIVILDML